MGVHCSFQILAVSLFLGSFVLTDGWGKEGHFMVCNIAEVSFFFFLLHFSIPAFHHSSIGTWIFFLLGMNDFSEISVG